MAKTYKTEGIVLKRFNFSEADRLVTIFTKNLGKVTVLAKGVRKLISKKKSSLEPATQAIFFFVQGKNLPVLTQTQLIHSFSQARRNLSRLTQTYQILEIVDLLTVENQENPRVYDLLLSTLFNLNTSGSKKTLLLSNIQHITQALGFAASRPLTEFNLKALIEDLAETKLRSKAYLMPDLSLVE